MPWPEHAEIDLPAGGWGGHPLPEGGPVMPKLTVALSKGRILAPTLDLLARAGYNTEFMKKRVMTESWF
jgi:hypothetical protein